MSDELLIRQLLWQNGLYRGLLALASKGLEMSTESEESVGLNEKLAAEIESVLQKPFPDALLDKAVQQ